MNQYIESYNKGNSDNIDKNNKDKYGLLESQKRIFNNFIFKSYVFSFFKRVKICLNTAKVYKIVENSKEYIFNYIIEYFISKYKNFSFNNSKYMVIAKLKILKII